MYGLGLQLYFQSSFNIFDCVVRLRYQFGKYCDVPYDVTSLIQTYIVCRIGIVAVSFVHCEA